MQTLAQASDPKQIPISARVNMGATNLWIQVESGRFSQKARWIRQTLLSRLRPR
ncbi:MAG: hypothetical protein KF798_02155 [Candidatus Paracaedibacteraceae bacterium]|nr:hypothetical protein [Candidatus Paracaedibacteraceae bacterium]